MTHLLPALLLALTTVPVAAEERFTINIDLDPDASARLVEVNEWITVEVSYYGEALPGAPETSWGRAWLGHEAFTVYPVSQAVEFGGSLAAMPVQWVEEPRVTVSITSANALQEASRIVCDTMEKPLSTLVDEGQATLECAWGEE
jgi:hypothetical protein